MKIIERIKNRKNNDEHFTSFLNKKMIIFVGTILFLVVGIMYTSYALFFDIKETTPQTIMYGDLEVTYKEGIDTITRTEDEPLTDEQGNATDPYIFTITNTGELPATCTILMSTDTSYLSSNSLTAVSDSQMKYSIDGYNVGIVGNLENTVLKTFYLLPGEYNTYNLRFWLKDDAPNSEMGKAFSKKIQVRAQYHPKSKKSLGSQILANNPPTSYTTVPGRENSTTDEGLIRGNKDDTGGITYYFRGTAPDNYVSFAGKTWRVVRINGDGSVRLILDESTEILSDWNTVESNQTFDMGLASATYGNSIIKDNVEAWYDENIGNNENYSSKVVPTKFCNDRTYTVTISNREYREDYFGTYSRLYKNQSVTNATPSFICPTNTSEGNDIYNLNAGLITADEVAFAGATYNSNNNDYYLAELQKDMWTMSILIWENSTKEIYAAKLMVNTPVGVTEGDSPENSNNPLYVTDSSLDYDLNVVPVISLSANTLVTVNPTNPGTIDNPYVVQ